MGSSISLFPESKPWNAYTWKQKEDEKAQHAKDAGWRSIYLVGSASLSSSSIIFQTLFLNAPFMWEFHIFISMFHCWFKHSTAGSVIYSLVQWTFTYI